MASPEAQKVIAEFISSFYKNILKSKKVKENPLQYLQTRLASLDKYWEDFYNNHLQIAIKEDYKQTKYITENHFEIVEEDFTATKAAILREIEKLEPPKRSSTISISSSATADPQGNIVLDNSIKHLPALSLPQFSGNQLEWESFRDMFTAMVDNTNLSDVQKLYYLKMSLTGKAAELVKNTPVSDANYAEVWSMLVKWYDNKRILLATHMRKLLSCPAASKRSVDELLRLLDAVNESIRAFHNMGRPIDSWDDWFVHILVHKLDSSTRESWETSLKESETFPKFKQLSSFIECRIRALEAANQNENCQSTKAANNSHQNSKSHKKGKKQMVSINVAQTDSKPKRNPCPLCKGLHFLAYCPQFKKLKSSQRVEQVQTLGLCLNCLREDHSLDQCTSLKTCFVCSCRHHTFLHDALSNTPNSVRSTPVSTSSESKGVSSQVNHLSALSSCQSSNGIFATAYINLSSHNDRSVIVKGFLDSGSECSLITERVAQTLKIHKIKCDASLKGIGDSSLGSCNYKAELSLRSPVDPNFELPLQALVLKSLIKLVPKDRPYHENWPHLKDLQLADPNYYQTETVDCVIGIDLLGHILLPGLKQDPLHSPTALLIVFGWILLGQSKLPSDPQDEKSDLSVLHLVEKDSISDQLRLFWESEEIPTKTFLTENESKCEKVFSENHYRDSTGRYVVRLPLSEPPNQLGRSRDQVVTMFLKNERRLVNDPNTKSKYNAFMQEYLALDHMNLVPHEEVASNTKYNYLPHHVIFKNQDPSSKIRVVFNGSFRTSSGVSLNDISHPGQKLQSDIWLIITRWRLWKYVFTADIVKMFRQILIHPLDCDLQRIVWRPEPTYEIQDYCLKTVTYGTRSAPFLAIRVLNQLASDERHRFPLGAEMLENHTYVDDIFAGANTIEDAKEIRKQLIAILSSAGITLSKWAANSVSLIPDYLTQLDEKDKDCWLSGSNWDAKLSDHLKLEWELFFAQIPEVELIQIPRWIHTEHDQSTWELHCFSDASERAYSAALYLVERSPSCEAQSHLVMAKTKLAPTKVISLPKLELSGAFLLAKLFNVVVSKLKSSVASIFFWTDSQIVLAWLQGHPSRWKPFVANRVSEIHSLTRDHPWNHVPSGDNPADCATRGFNPSELQQSSLWWHGPKWLLQSDDNWPAKSVDAKINLEVRPKFQKEDDEVLISLIHKAETPELLSRVSSLTKLVRVTAFCYRFIHRSRGTVLNFDPYLNALEIKQSLIVWVRISQRNHLHQVVDTLKAGKTISPKEPIAKLKPFLDDDGILRVGGRLQYSCLSYDEKHPMIISKQDKLAEMIVDQAHQQTLHGSQQLTLSRVSRQFWIISAKTLINKVIRNCVRCARCSPTSPIQLMGQLPAERVTASKPFTFTGLDYAGPYNLLPSKKRGIKSTKGYVCLFVCLCSRAIHLEVVSDCETTTFIAAFKRFISRRGHCVKIYSDNARNFIGAERELKRLFTGSTQIFKEAAELLANQGTTWSFIPPQSPHFGGLWEAGIKSVKHHLRRVVGETRLTFEEMSTVLCQIEACLNSRPLYPNTADPNSVSAITPGHLLTGGPISAVPEPPMNEITNHNNHRWATLTRMRDNFWSRWSQEYLHTLQQRSKWLIENNSVKVGDVVLVKEDNLPPTKWRLARIVELHPGKDQLSRVATIKTDTSTLKRSFAKLALLPVNQTNSNQQVIA